MSSSVGRNRGKVVVISGPSGTGKTSICDSLLERLPDAVWSVSATTRPPRGAESAGRNYEYVTCQEFERRRDADELLEAAEYCEHWYGTPAGPVRQWVADGRTVIMEIDVQGGKQLARSMPESVRIFVLPPDLESLKARLEGRKTESQEHMAKRLEAADGEIAFARDSGCYQHFVTNDVLESTVDEIIEILNRP